MTVLYQATDAEVDAELSFEDIEARFAPKLSFPLQSAVLVDGAPVVGRDKEDRLKSVLRKLFDSRGFPVQELDMPFSDADQSKGLVFVIFKDPSVAQQAAVALDGHPFDKRHTLGVHTFDDVERLQTIQEDFEEPKIEQYQEREHLRSWLADSQSRDQVALLRADDMQVNWFNRNGSLSLAYDQPKPKAWTETYTQWSPLGTFLVTVHGQGVALWGGASFDRINRFAHPGANLIDFSPNERYLVTWSPKPLEIPPGALNNPNFPYTEDDEGSQVCIWEVLTGKLMRSFPMLAPPPPPPANAQGVPEEKKRQHFVWPLFKWSGDERYFARLNPGIQIQIYETPHFGLLQKKSVKIDGVVDFDWCPLGDKEREQDAAREEAIAKGEKNVVDQETMLAYWVPEIANQPARVTLMSVPSRTTLRSKNLVNVSDCKIHWQSNGDFLCVKVDRHTKTKKTMFSNLEIFRVREKGLPVDTIDVKDTVTAFAWEPKGDRFLLITSNDPNVLGMPPGGTLKTSVSFYQLDTRKGDFLQLKTIENKSVNTIFWSPKGRHVVTATLGSTSKFDVDFWDCDLEGRQEVGGPQSAQTDLAAGIQMLASTDHYGMTAIEWDPSGRYVTLAGTTWQTSMEPGYAIHTFAGAEVTKVAMDKLKQILWRPRPPTLLTRADQRKIKRNLREFAKQFEEADAAEESTVSKELLDQRKRLVDEWNAWRNRVKSKVEREREEMGRKPPGKLVDFSAKAQEVQTVEEWVDTIISETEEVVGMASDDN